MGVDRGGLVSSHSHCPVPLTLWQRPGKHRRLHRGVRDRPRRPRGQRLLVHAEEDVGGRPAAARASRLDVKHGSGPEQAEARRADISIINERLHKAEVLNAFLLMF